MRPSLRFLALATVGWAGVRVAMAGDLPNLDFFNIGRGEARAAEITSTQFPAIEPIAPAQPMAAALPESPAQVAMTAAAPVVRYVQGMVGVPVAMSRGVVPVYQLPAAMPAAPGRPGRYYDARSAEIEGYSRLPEVDGWPAARLAGVSLPGTFVSAPQSIPAAPVPPIDPRRFDRLQLSSWALLRSQQTGVAGSRSLASGGQLGASQAGARLIYNIDRRLASPPGPAPRSDAAAARSRRASESSRWSAFRSGSPLNGGRPSANMVADAALLPSSSKAASISALCRGIFRSTATFRAGSSASKAAICSSMGVSP